MKEIQYRRFSFKTHKKNWLLNKPNSCQFELTFKCALHCKHCYTDCYNKAVCIKDELTTKEVKFILDKVYKSGILWVCFTGGDPLTREDFLDIYAYSKEKGNLNTIFTSGYSLTKEIINYFKRKPPFAIELTLNAVTEEGYEKISQVKGSFEKIMRAIQMLTKANLPLKIKTQITRQNLEELSQIKRFIENLGLEFRATTKLHARLDGDLTPCELRIPPQDILNLSNNRKFTISDCESHRNYLNHKSQDVLFYCAALGRDGISISPYGDAFFCNLIRNPAFNLFEIDVKEAQNRLFLELKDRKFMSNSKCNGCELRKICFWCPGAALLEKGDMEAPIEYYCQVAAETVKGNFRKDLRKNRP